MQCLVTDMLYIFYKIWNIFQFQQFKNHHSLFNALVFLKKAHDWQK